ncbi:siroheme synthase [Halobacteriales archaeon QS_9_68_17]|nr:MAG: siroheme synthase [Halobacteriales archaeon QS_9_68_17]
MIPLLHDFTGATVLVFGGGRVGARKARRFAREARVVVVSPDFGDADFGDSERVRASPTPDDIAEWVDRFDPPATVRDDPVVAAVATGGASPALSKHLRESIEAEIAGAGGMAELTADLREELQDEGVPPADRRDAVRAVVRSSRVWKGLRRGDSNERQVARDVINDAPDSGDTR